MVQTTKIAIDLDVHRAIEHRRTSFDQSPNAILRDILNLPSASAAIPLSDPKPRRTGTYAFLLLGDRVEAGSLKLAYMTCLRRLGELDPQFFERLSLLTTRSRRVVARKPTDLYLKKPELAEKHAVRLTGRWWVDTNLNRPQCEQRLRMACEVAGLQFGGDDGGLILDFPDGEAPTPGLKDLLAAAPLEGIDIERSRNPGREVDF
ncbi:MAG: hypothetical protein OXI22_21260 [Defluviicoccus sp.]|nr:hypothetical protein [Defluviicoccus sp.]MDE0386424.1 hypothetical protein [Defluviicoccus sp.]